MQTLTLIIPFGDKPPVPGGEGGADVVGADVGEKVVGADVGEKVVGAEVVMIGI